MIIPPMNYLLCVRSLYLLEIGEMVISAFTGLVGLGPAGRVFTCSLLE